MAVYGKKLLDNEGNTILPKTRASLVYTSDDETVESVLAKLLSGTGLVGHPTTAATGKAWNYLYNDARYQMSDSAVLDDTLDSIMSGYVGTVMGHGANTGHPGNGWERYFIMEHERGGVNDMTLFAVDTKPDLYWRRRVNGSWTSWYRAVKASGDNFRGDVGFFNNVTVNGTTWLNGTNVINGTATFNNNMHLGGYCSMGVNKSPGNGFNAQPIHIPNISANINAVILWT